LSSQAIGIFDSGVGGLSVALAIRKQLPWEDLVYVADSAHTPYGNKSQQFIVQRARAIVEFLLSQKVKAIVVACNTATVSAIAQLREEFDIPIVGMEPGVKPAAELSTSGVVGVMATTQTLQSASFLTLVSRFAQNRQVVAQACPGLVEQVEAMDLTSLKTDTLLQSYLNPLLEKGADRIVLGCTHYGFLTKRMVQLVKGRAEIVNTNDAVAREVVRRLRESKLMQMNCREPSERFYSSIVTPKTEQVISYYWGKNIKVESF
jgi:glutamate racemase